MEEWRFKRRFGRISTAICGITLVILMTLWACGVGSLLLYLMCFPVGWAALNSYFYTKRAQDELNVLRDKVSEDCPKRHIEQ